MPALDACHAQIVRALQKDGWQVVESPQRLTRGARTVFIDLKASRYQNGSQQQILLAEIKCFPDRDSTTRELYIAVGQYAIYQTMLTLRRINLPLYLAIPLDVYRDIFDEVVRHAIEIYRIKLVVVDLSVEEIVEWIEPTN